MLSWKIDHNFLDSIKEISYKMQDKYKIPAILLMAISALETGWGKDENCKYNNYFNCKWWREEHSGKMEKYIKKTWEQVKGEKQDIYSDFIHFKSVEECFEYICNRISTNDIYYRTQNIIKEYANYLDNPYFCSIIALSLNDDGYSTHRKEDEEDWHKKIINIICRIDKQYKGLR